MMRTLVLRRTAAVAILLVGFSSLAQGDEPTRENSGEVIDTFLESLNADNDSDDSDRCPGETEADRIDAEPAPVTAADDMDQEPSSDAATAELTDEPQTLPDGIDAAPIPGKPGTKREKKAAMPAVDLQLSSEMLEFKEELRDTLAWYYDRPQKVNDRSPWGIMHWLIPYGVDSYLLDTSGKRQNTIGYLCYNYPCKGQRLFHLDSKGQMAAHIGPGLQGHRGQFLAMLAQSKVDPAYPMRIEGRDFTVADLIEYEKRTCEAGTELTFKLIALAHYSKHDDKWKNTRGEEWDIPRLIREELKQPVVGAACGGTHRMTGFSFAVRKHEARNLLMDGQWNRASKFIDAYHDYTFSLQNRDGSFSTNWFASKGDLPDPQRRLQTSGHIAEWLVYSVSPEKLQDKEVVDSVKYVTRLLAEGKQTRWEIGPLGHALHALALYDERVFGGKPGQRGEQLAGRGKATKQR